MRIPLALVLLCMCSTPIAAEPAKTTGIAFSASEVSDSLFEIGGADLALSGNINASGWMIRVTSGIGMSRFGSRFSQSGVAHTVTLSTTALAGYRFHGSLGTLNLLAGASLIDRHSDSPGADPAVGSAFGPAVAFDLWLTINDPYVITASGSYSSAFNTYWLRYGQGIRVSDSVVVGPEMAISGNFAAQKLQVGAFVSGLRLNDFTMRLACGAYRTDTGITGLYGSLAVWVAF